MDAPEDDHDQPDNILRKPVTRRKPRGPYDAGNVLPAVAVTFVLTWILLALVVIGSNDGTIARYFAVVMIVVALAFLVPQRTRRAGGGALIGMVVGIILGSGTCTAMVGTGCVLC